MSSGRLSKPSRGSQMTTGRPSFPSVASWVPTRSSVGVSAVSEALETSRSDSLSRCASAIEARRVLALGVLAAVVFNFFLGGMIPGRSVDLSVRQEGAPDDGGSEWVIASAMRTEQMGVDDKSTPWQLVLLQAASLASRLAAELASASACPGLSGYGRLEWLLSNLFPRFLFAEQCLPIAALSIFDCTTGQCP